MASIVVAGAGVCGMASALMLAHDGHDVTVVERDAAECPTDPNEAFSGWERTGVSQFRMGHILLARGRTILNERIPDVVEELRALGGFELTLTPPPTLETWEPQDGDDRFNTVTARRAVIDQAFANVIARTDGVVIRRGIPLAGLHVNGENLPGVPHVAGVTTDDGEIIQADLVIDAMGRRSPMLRWLAMAGGPAPSEQSVDSGFAYYGQYLQSDDGSLPAFKAPGLTPFHGYSILTIPADNGSWFCGVYASSKDSEMRVLRDRDSLHRLVGSCPLHAHFLEGRELTEVTSMVGVTDRDRRYVVDGSPVVTGMLPVADAWACTNPSLGRGMSIGIDHARHLADTLRESSTDPVELSLRWDEVTQREVAPWHQATRATDQLRAAELAAQQAGVEFEPDPADVGAQIGLALAASSPYNQEMFRIFAEILHILDLPANIMSRPGALDALIQASASRSAPEIPGPTRAEFLEMIG